MKQKHLLITSIILVLVITAAGLIYFVSNDSSTPVIKSNSSAKISRVAKKPKLVPATFLSSYGIKSNKILKENLLPGTSSWQITAPNTNTQYIQGFANLTYASVGQTVNLYVSTTSSSYSLALYRMGYYQGYGGRQVFSADNVLGQVQPTCPVDTKVNMVYCTNWTNPYSLNIKKSYMQGDYLIKLTAASGQQSYIPLIIWNPNSHAAYLVVARTLTEEGWNTYGGYSYYTGKGPCILNSGSYPPCNRARIVSFDRPFAQGNGASDFLQNEYPLVQYMEKHGLDVAYVSDITLNDFPNIASNHKAILSLGHDETWTTPERQGVQAAIATGVNVIFFGAAAVLRHSRLQSSAFGPDREEVDYRNSSEDPLNNGTNPLNVTGNTFSAPPTSWSEVPLTGEVYSGYVILGKGTFPLVVTDPTSWLYQGTGLKLNQQVPNVIQTDFDHFIPHTGSPSNLDILAHSPLPITSAYTNQGTWNGNTYSDFTYYTNKDSNAGVIDTGTTNFIYAMGLCTTSGCPSSPVRIMVKNMLHLFGQGPTGFIEPSTGNWNTVTPAGS